MHPVPVKMVSGHVAGYDLFAINDVVTIMAGRKTLLKHKAQGLSDFLEKHGGRVRLSLGKTEDFSLFGFHDPENFGYVINLEAPDLSEWGYQE